MACLRVQGGLGPTVACKDKLRDKVLCQSYSKSPPGTWLTLLFVFPLLADLHPRWTTHTPSLAGSESPEPVTRDPFNTEAMASTLADTGTTVMGSSQPVVSRGTADNLIPVYCSILAAVVVGLVAYIAFKR